MQGVDKMARLRIYHANKGDMLALIRYQREEKVSGEEEIIFTSKEMFIEERRQKKALGEMTGAKIYRIPYPQVRKMIAIQERIFGL